MGKDTRVEMFIAICALVSSLVAVFIAWDQGRVMRAQQHGEVYPVLQVDGQSTNTSTYSTLGIKVSNSGVGPALIESVIMEIDGEEVTGLPAVFGDLPPPSSDSSSALAGRALAPGQEIDAISLRWNRDLVTTGQMFEIATDAQNWVLKICYCSVFGRCWQTNRIGTGRADRVKTCVKQDTDIFAEFTIRNFPVANSGPVPAEQDASITD